MTIILVWLALNLPIAILIGRCIRFADGGKA